jgi:leucyl-tRNA synthetase
LRDAVFSRQRYWGEPFPVYYVNGLPQMIDAQHLPIILPEVEKYLPTEDGQPPLGNALVWAWDSKKLTVVGSELIDDVTIFPLELNTMPGWAGSSWYWMRYMDAHNDNEFASKEALAYWESVDLYIGGSEHATGHLLYSRFWNKFLKDKGFAPTEEPFKKLINQGMILGMSALVYRINYSIESELYPDDITSEFNDFKNKLPNKYGSILVSSQIGEKGNEYLEELLSKISFYDLITNEWKEKTKELLNIEGDRVYLKFQHLNKIHTPIEFLIGSTDDLDIFKFKNTYSDLKNAIFIDFEGKEIITTNQKFTTVREIEKMSKSKYNVVTPDDICTEYGADTLRLYEMFLGPLEQAKPWNTAGISGVFGFLKKLCRLYFDENGLIITNDEPTKDNLKSLHKTIKKVAEDIESFSFNTSVSQFMICVNELSTQNCHSRAILEPLAIVISPYAPHIAEELWSLLGNTGSVATVNFPIFEPAHLVESSKEYPVSFNGKMRFTMVLPLDLTAPQIEEIVMKDERTIKQLEGRTPNKVIIVPGKIINLVG